MNIKNKILKIKNIILIYFQIKNIWKTKNIIILILLWGDSYVPSNKEQQPRDWRGD